jgi:predicted transcriptional regulator
MNTQLTILKILRVIQPRMMTTSSLWSETLMEEGEVSYSGYKTALRELEEKEQVVVVRGEDRERAKITDAGLARLAENGI